MNVLFAILCLKLYTYSDAFESTMEFAKLTDWLLPDNWENNVAPCPGDVISFPKDLKMGIFMEFGTKQVFNVTLPNSGELLFDDNAFFEPYDFESAVTEVRCRNREKDAYKEVRKYTASEGSWHNPNNWYMVNYTYYKPFLHAERIPSTWDNAVFGPDNSWKVGIEDAVVVKLLKYAGKETTTENIYKHFRSVEGSYSFVDNRGHAGEKIEEMMPELEFESDELDDTSTYPITINQAPCNKRSGCVRNNIRDTPMMSICQYVKCLSTGKLGCTNPIKPVGHCCNICGSRIRFTGDTSFEYRGFVDHVSSRFLRKGIKAKDFELTEWRMSFLMYQETNYRYQFIIASKYDNGSDYDQSAVQYIQDTVVAALKTTHGVFPATIATWISTPASSRHHAAGWVLFVMLLVFFILGTLATIWWQRKKTSQTLSSIATRFMRSDDTADDKVTLNLASTRRRSRNPYEIEEEGYDIAPVSAGSLQGFENPSYRELLKSEKDKDMEEKALEMVNTAEPEEHIYEDIDDHEGATYFSNPLFEAADDSNK